jgi:alcohol dehydrogenase (cytochrome c)
MIKTVFLAASIVSIANGQVKDFQPVTNDMLLNPSPDDWLMFSRTYDAQRFSPLNQINKQNVSQLKLAWSRGMGAGTTETIPTVYRGVMYMIAPGSIVQALDATNGDLIWEYKRKYPTPQTGTGGRSKTLAIYDDMVYFTAPDSYVVALDARTGAVRWETKADSRGHTSGPIVVDGKVVAGGTCNGGRVNCYIGAYDAKTGKEVWKFYTTQAANDPAGDSWGGAPEDKRTASTWALPGSYDPVRKLILWGIANPTPNTRSARHGGNAFAIPLTSPADLYSNSTVALDPATGKLAWYYQHLPGDDWDEDINEERTLLRTAVNPDPKYVKWINPDIPKGDVRDISVNVGEGGGMWAVDRSNGQFLWATPFPFDVPNFILSGIDVKTGRAHINEDLIVGEPGQRRLICFFNTRSYWPTSYNPSKNSLYVPYYDICLDQTSAAPATADHPATPEKRFGGRRPGADPDHLVGLAKVNMSTGEIQRWSTGSRATSTGAVLATAGDLVFWGDLNRRLRAFDADSGKILWEQVVGGPISVSTITYAVNGKQYVSVITGDNLAIPGLLGDTNFAGVTTKEFSPARGHNAVYVFALP